VLTGGQEVAPADPAGRGFAVVQVGRHNRVCYALSAWGLAGTVTGAHIHQAPVGKNGPVKVTLQPPVHGGSVGCSTVAGALARALRSHPADFYVNVHTSAFPDGAVRGQLHG
jgi:hypothetical protein